MASVLKMTIWKECPSMSLENDLLANQFWENSHWATNLELIHNWIWKILSPDRITDQVSQLFEIPWWGKLVCKKNCLFKHGNFNAKFMQKFWIQNHFWNDIIYVWNASLVKTQWFILLKWKQRYDTETNDSQKILGVSLCNLAVVCFQKKPGFN